MTPTQRNIIIGIVIALLIAAGLWYFLRTDLRGQIVVPYISHQQPVVDPHLPHAVPLSDKLDEVLFDGLFNISANSSGVVYEDGMGELIDISEDNVVTIRLNTRKKWHSSYSVTQNDDEITINETSPKLFSAEDLRFTLQRIQRLGSLSPDYILVSQAVESFNFTGPDNNNEIRFQLKGDRIWNETDIKEIFSFKILPADAKLTQSTYSIGSGPYLAVNRDLPVSDYQQNPAGEAAIPRVTLKPFIDNSTFTTELKNNSFNVLLDTPFGAKSPILEDPEDYFYKSNISTTFFAVLFNTQRLNRDQRKEARRLLDNGKILNRFYKVNSEQQRHISDYKGNFDNYNDYLNYSIFPSSSYYVEEEVVLPLRSREAPNLAILPDSLRIVTSINHGHREELSELVEILNDPSLFSGRIKASAVQNEQIKRGDYDAVLIAVSGYRSTFLFDLYSIFLREPDMEQFKINLKTETRGGELVAANSSLNGNNFNRLDATKPGPDQGDIQKFLEYTYGFMYTNQIGDKQAYATFIDELDQDLALGSWLFSLPSMAYFTTQFDDRSINLYGVASQLSTIEKWQEQRDE